MAMSLKALYDKQGFVIVPGLVREQDREELCDACERVIKRTRSGHWPHRRTWGRQFPPFGDDDKPEDSWGVQHLMHPELGEPVFARWYTTYGIMQVAQELLACEEEDLQMGEWRKNIFWALCILRCFFVCGFCAWLGLVGWVESSSFCFSGYLYCSILGCDEIWWMAESVIESRPSRG